MAALNNLSKLLLASQKAPAKPPVAAPKKFSKPSPIGSKSTANTVKDPRSLIGFSPR